MEVVRLRSPLCDVVGIEIPLIQAGMSIFTSPALAAAVSDAGALGSLGAWNLPPTSSAASSPNFAT